MKAVLLAIFSVSLHVCPHARWTIWFCINHYKQSAMQSASHATKRSVATAVLALLDQQSRIVLLVVQQTDSTGC